MRITYRTERNFEYWTRRWEDVPIDAESPGDDHYPIKYAVMAVKPGSEILEAGCGPGRVLRYFHARGFRISAFDFIPDVVQRLKEALPEVDLQVADVRKLPYKAASFDSVLAFGLYHNLENGLDEAVRETLRVLRPGGVVCASFRADNIQNRLNDWLAARGEKAGSSEGREFHKMNLRANEVRDLFARNGFQVREVLPVVNMPLLYKFEFFRAAAHKKFNEKLGRKEGYRLSWIGALLQGWLISLAPYSFCNIYVITAERPMPNCTGIHEE